MLNVLCTGTLVNDPKSRTTATGKAYVTASMRVPCEDADPLLVSIIAFNADAVQAILALSRGDSVAVAGRAKLSEWTAQDGTEKRGLSVVVDKALSLYMIDKKRRQVSQPEEAAA